MCAEMAEEAKEAVTEQGNEAKSAVKTESEQVAELQEKLKRVAAEADNFRRRQEANLERRVESAKDDVFRKLLPLLDHLEMAVAASQNTQDIAALTKGVELVVKDLTHVFDGFGVKPIEVEIDKAHFDPALHEAVMVEERDDLPDETVSLVLKKGYLFGDRVLRPAMVRVARHSG